MLHTTKFKFHTIVALKVQAETNCDGTYQNHSLHSLQTLLTEVHKEIILSEDISNRYTVK